MAEDTLQGTPEILRATEMETENDGMNKLTQLIALLSQKVETMNERLDTISYIPNGQRDHRDILEMRQLTQSQGSLFGNQGHIIQTGTVMGANALNAYNASLNVVNTPNIGQRLQIPCVATSLTSNANDNNNSITSPRNEATANVGNNIPVTERMGIQNQMITNTSPIGTQIPNLKDWLITPVGLNTSGHSNSEAGMEQNDSPLLANLLDNLDSSMLKY